VRLLLTSAGVKNPSIRDALIDLLGKPIADSVASLNRRNRSSGQPTGRGGRRADSEQTHALPPTMRGTVVCVAG
jgi:hypothetical protein